VTALVIKGLRSGYEGPEILRGIDCTIERGQVVAVVGRNGVGKSTLTKTIMGIVRPRAGRVLLNGHDVAGRAPHSIARRGVAYVPQEKPLFDELSVRANLEIVLPRTTRLREHAERAFSFFPVLAERLGQKAGTLSGGERKMLMVARVLLQNPDVVLLDEVTEGVQPSAVALIGTAIEEERRRGAGVMLVEQKIDFALASADRVLVMKHGEIVVESEVGTTTAAEIERHLVL
jgi:branched-chain amino acid transport system ATP-binding protein